MRRTLPLLAALLCAAACGPFARDFHVGGTITVASNMQSRVPRDGAVIFVVVKNSGGVPLAVKRIVNPQFPVSFLLDSEDLLVPDSPPHEAVFLEVQMNTHGNVGSPVRGDFSGLCPDPVSPGKRNVSIVIDRQL